MGVDYDAEGGIGYRVTGEILYKLGYYKEEDNEESEEDVDTFLDRIGIPYLRYGSAYERDGWKYAWVIDSHKYKEVKDRIPKFIEDLHNAGIDIVEDDLEVIVELSIW